VRVALSSYRSKPHSGGQGVYVRHLSRELVRLGHEVEVFSGPPYPELDDGVRLTRVPSLDLYRPQDPFRRPALHEFRSPVDVLEYAIMCTAGFPEPRTFSLRLARLLRDRAGAFDVLHDNQTLGPGLLRIARTGLPVLTTIHHPISVDRRLALAQARGWGRLTTRRWYGFVGMQRRVARRSEHVLTVSRQARDDVAAEFGVPPERMRVVPVGVDVDTFAPREPAGHGPGHAPGRAPGRVVAVTSADVPLKGLPVLVEALARLRHAGRGVELVVVGTAGARTERAIADAGLGGRVTFRSGLAERDLAELMASAALLAVPSLYEGFCLPAVEAMACGTPVVASRVGALPELLGAPDGVPGGPASASCGVLVPPGDPVALADAMGALLDDPDRRAALGAAGRRRAVATYSWTAVARATADVYADTIAGTTARTTARATARRPAGRAAASALPAAEAAGDGGRPERPAA